MMGIANLLRNQQFGNIQPLIPMNRPMLPTTSRGGIANLMGIFNRSPGIQSLVNPRMNFNPRGSQDLLNLLARQSMFADFFTPRVSNDDMEEDEDNMSTQDVPVAAPIDADVNVERSINMNNPMNNMPKYGFNMPDMR